MAYVPNNLVVFVQAYSGAMAGMVASGRFLTDATSADYTNPATVIGAFAQSFDTAWGATEPDFLQSQMINAACKSVWEDRFNTNTGSNATPASYTALCNAIIATIAAAETYFGGQGIVPPPDDIGAIELGKWATGAGGNNVLHADSPFQATVVNPCIPVDTTGGAVQVNTPANPVDGQLLFVCDAVGNAGVTPIVVHANNAGETIDEPQLPGTYGANANITGQGVCIGWKYRASDKKWIAFSGL